MLPNRKTCHQNQPRLYKFSSFSNSCQLGVPSQSFDSHFFNTEQPNQKSIKTKMLKSQQLGNMVLQFSHKEINSRLKAQHKKYSKNGIKRLRQVQNLWEDKRKIVETSLKNQTENLSQQERKDTFGANESPSDSHSFIKIIDCLETVRKNQLLNYQKSQNSDSKANLFSSGDTYIFNLISRRSQRQSEIIQKQTRILANHSINNTKKVWEKQKGNKFVSFDNMIMTKTRAKSKQLGVVSMENYNSINIMQNIIGKGAQAKQKVSFDKNNIDIVESISIQYHDQENEAEKLFPFSSQQCYSPVRNQKHNERILVNRSCEQRHNNQQIQNVLQYFSTNKIISSGEESQSFQQQLGYHSGNVNKLSFSKEKSSFPQNLLTLSNQLDLGVKIIDDSFEISAIDEQAGSHEIWINISLENNKKSNKWQETQLYRKEMEDVILDESEVIAENEQLKQKLNLLLERGSIAQQNGGLNQQKMKSENCSHNHKDQSKQVFEQERKEKIPQKRDRVEHQEDGYRLKQSQIYLERTIYFQKKIGLIYQSCSYQVRQHLRPVYKTLVEKIKKIGFHKNIISVYHFTESSSGLTIYKQLFFQQTSLKTQIYLDKLEFYHGISLESLLKSSSYFQISKMQVRNLIKQLLSLYVIATKFNLQMNLSNIYICPLSPAAKQFSIKIDFAKLQSTSINFQNIETTNLVSIYESTKYLKSILQKLYPHPLAQQYHFLLQMNVFISFLEQQISLNKQNEQIKEQRVSNQSFEIDKKLFQKMRKQSNGKRNDIQISQILTHPFIYENGNPLNLFI